MWTRFWLRVLSASLVLKHPLTEAASWRSECATSVATGPFTWAGEAASESRGSVISSASEVGVYTSAHPLTRVSTSRWLSPSDAPADSWIGAAQNVTAGCSSRGDSEPCLPLATSRPMGGASPPAPQSYSATPSSPANGSREILTETAAQVDGAAAASASPALSIIPADPSTTPEPEASPDFSAEALQYSHPIQPPSIWSARPPAPSQSANGSLPAFGFSPVNSSVFTTLSPIPTSFPPLASSADPSPPTTPGSLSIGSTATPPPFASANVVKSAAVATGTDGSEPTSNLSFNLSSPHASALSNSTRGYGVAPPLAKVFTSFKFSTITLAAATASLISSSMALSFTSTSAAVTSAGASPTGSLFPTASQTSPTFSPDSASIFLCGDRAFRPSEYTCYDGSTLCPVQGGGRFESCGGSCYDPGLYGCVSGGLQPIVDGKFLDGMTPSHTIAVPVTQWPSNVPTPLLSSISSSSPTTSPTSSRTSSTLSTSTRSSSTSSKTSSKSSSTSSSTSSTASSTSSSSSSSSASASASSSSTAAPTRDDDNGNGLSTNQIAAIASSISAAAVIFIMAGFFLFRRHKSQTARASQQVYPELAYLYDPPVPGSENGSRGALPSGASPRTPGGGGGSGEPVGPFGVGGPGGSDGDDDGATGAGATALGATLRGGGGSSDQRSSSPEGRSAGSRSSSVGSVVSFLGPGGRPPVMGEGMAALNGSSSGSSNAALLAASARRDREAGNGSPLAPVPSRSDDENAANGEEARPFLTAAGAVAAGGSSGASSRDRSAERGGAVTTHQRDETALWNGEEMDRELGERLHEQQVEEARQRRERARAFLLQAKERQEQRIPMPSHAPANGESSAGMTAAAAGAAAVGGAAAALASKGQQRNATNPKLQHMQSREQQWWQQPSSPTATSPTQSSGAAFFPPPAATHANQGYYPIYPPISPTYPRSGPILTSQHIEANRLEQVQHARATAAAASSPPTTTTAYPTFHRPGPNNYPAPSNWQQSPNGSYTYTNNGATAAAAAASVRGRPFFHQNTSYVPPHRATIDNYSSLSSPNNNNGFGPIVNAPRRGSAGSIQSGSVYSTIPEEESHPPQRPQQQQQRKQSLQSIMRQMNSLDEEDSEGDEGQGFLQAPRRVLSVRNGAVTPSTDGEEDERDGGARRSGGAKKEVRWARDDGVERNLI